jgi:23S rRNA (cytosine1962-C5)-methyltransferase
LIKVLQIETVGLKQKFFKSPWLFSNQIIHKSDNELNEDKISLVQIKGTKKVGVYCKNSLISIRFLPDSLFEKIENGFIKKDHFIDVILNHLVNLKKAKSKFNFTNKEAFRLSHGDNYGLPAIAIDDYQYVLVLQSSSQAGEYILPYVIEALKQIDERSVFERSTGQIRKLENLPERTRWIREPLNKDQNFEINCLFSSLNMTFFLNKAQKTGLFLDQRNNLTYLANIIKNYNINSCLDICSYAGSWSSIAANSGVENLTLIDQDSWALNLAKRNILANAKGNTTIETLHGDMFEHMQGLIKNEKKFDLIIAAPPQLSLNQKNIFMKLKEHIHAWQN